MKFNRASSEDGALSRSAPEYEMALTASERNDTNILIRAEVTVEQSAPSARAQAVSGTTRPAITPALPRNDWP